MIKNLSKNIKDLDEKTREKYSNMISQEEKEIFYPNYYSYNQILEMVCSEEYYVLADIEDKTEKVRGYIILHDSIDILEIMKVGTSEQFRNKGIAEGLIKEILKITPLNLYLEVRESNLAARNFYKKNGFSEVSKRKNYYKDNNENAIIMLLER